MRAWQFLLIAAVFSAACGSSETGSPDVEADAVPTTPASSDDAGSYPFSTWSRCYDDHEPNTPPPDPSDAPDELRPGCLRDGEVSPLPAGAQLVGDPTADFDVTLRGGVRIRGDWDDPANPEFAEVHVALDITVTSENAKQFGSSGLDAVQVSTSLPDATAGTEQLSDCERPVTPAPREAFLLPGETMTFVYCKIIRAPSSMIGETIVASASASAGTDAAATEQNRAVLDISGSIPAEALDDLATSVARAHELDGIASEDAPIVPAMYQIDGDLVTDDQRGSGATTDGQDGPDDSFVDDGFNDDGFVDDGFGEDDGLFGDDGAPGEQGDFIELPPEGLPVPELDIDVPSGEQQAPSVGGEMSDVDAELEIYDDGYWTGLRDGELDGENDETYGHSHSSPGSGFYSRPQDPAYVATFDEGYLAGYDDGYGAPGSGTVDPSGDAEDCPEGQSLMECFG